MTARFVVRRMYALLIPEVLASCFVSRFRRAMVAVMGVAAAVFKNCVEKIGIAATIGGYQA
jgi:hypothetical protein